MSVIIVTLHMIHVLVLQGHRSRTNSPEEPKKPSIRLQAPASPPSPVGPRHGRSVSKVCPFCGSTAHRGLIPPSFLCHNWIRSVAENFSLVFFLRIQEYCMVQTWLVKTYYPPACLSSLRDGRYLSNSLPPRKWYPVGEHETTQRLARVQRTSCQAT